MHKINYKYFKLYQNRFNKKLLCAKHISLLWCKLMLSSIFCEIFLYSSYIGLALYCTMNFHLFQTDKSYIIISLFFAQGRAEPWGEIKPTWFSSVKSHRLTVISLLPEGNAGAGFLSLSRCFSNIAVLYTHQTMLLFYGDICDKIVWLISSSITEGIYTSCFRRSLH